MNITQTTEEFIQEHPYIRACLKKGLINYSSLTRMIATDCKLDIKKNFDAILIACRRYRQKIKLSGNEKDITELLSKSKVEVKNKILVVVLENSISSQSVELIENKIRKEKSVFRLIESASAITMVTTEDYSSLIKDSFRNKIIDEKKGLVEVTLKSSKEIERIPGVMAFIFSLFAEFNINIIETMSSWTDTIFVIEEKDIGKVMEIMRF